MAGMKRWNSLTGPVRYRSQEQCGTTSKHFSTERWGPESRWSEEESQTLTQQSSQRTQPSSSVPTNHFENILATQRHSEVTSHLKQSSKSTSEAHSSQFAAITECLEQLQLISKSVAGFAADARRLERSNRQQFDSLERKISGVEDKICVILRMVKENDSEQPAFKENFSASLSSSISSIQVMDSFQDNDEGICVTDYLQELGRKRSGERVRCPDSVSNGTISSQSSTRRDCSSILMLGTSDGYDDLFEEDGSIERTGQGKMRVRSSSINKPETVVELLTEPRNFELTCCERSVNSSRKRNLGDDISNQSKSQSRNGVIRYDVERAITPISSICGRIIKPIRWGGDSDGNVLQNANKRARQEYRRVG